MQRLYEIIKTHTLHFMKQNDQSVFIKQLSYSMPSLEFHRHVAELQCRRPVRHQYHCTLYPRPKVLQQPAFRLRIEGARRLVQYQYGIPGIYGSGYGQPLHLALR